MAMKQINVAEATGPALDWLVAKCEGILDPVHGESAARVVLYVDQWQTYMRLNPPPQVYYSDRYEPSTNWAQGGPIIDMEAHNLFKHNGGTEWCCACNVPRDGYTAIVTADGPTPLIAAMRCYVASKLGDTVEVPEELL